MDFIQHFSEHHDQLLYLIAGLSFIVELSIMGLSGPLLFFGIACFLTGLLVSAGLVSGWEAEAFVIGGLTGATALMLWKPLKRFQNTGGGPDTSSDMIGQQVPTSSEINFNGGSIRHSGINWNARLDPDCGVDSIPNETRCVISGVDGNILTDGKTGDNVANTVAQAIAVSSSLKLPAGNTEEA